MITTTQMRIALAHEPHQPSSVIAERRWCIMLAAVLAGLYQSYYLLYIYILFVLLLLLRCFRD
jgi:hypothetical protein